MSTSGDRRLSTSEHSIHACHHHLGWDNSLAPACRIAPGETIEMECIDASGGQLDASSTAADVPQVDPSRINPVTGPVHVEGAQPGDALRLTVEALAPALWGWTANIPGFGLLSDDFPDPRLHVWSIDAQGRSPAAFGAARVPLRPFLGTIGVAPGEPGRHSVIPPRRVGGNLDLRDLTEGVELWLPVEVPGALLSAGDGHAAQGDGEVCGTAIECPLLAALHVDVVRDARLAFPRFRTPGPVTRHVDERGYEATTGVGPDLMGASRDAVRGMIELLADRYGLAPVDVYLLCSVCGDLRISEIVDAPNWVVSFYFPRTVFD